MKNNFFNYFSKKIDSYLALFKNLSIKVKLLLCFILISSLIIPLSYSSIHNIKKINDSFNIVVNQTFPRIEALIELKNVALQIQTLTKNFSFSKGDTTQIEGTNAANLKYELLARLTELDKWIKQYLNKSDNHAPDNLTIINKLQKSKDTIMFSALSITELYATSGNQTKIQEQRKILDQAEQQITDDIATLISQESRYSQKQENTAYETAIQARNFAMMFFVLLVLFSLLVSLLLARIISFPIIQLRDFVLSLKDVNTLRQISVTSEDEIGQLGHNINDMIKNLHDSQEKITTLNKELVNTARQAGMAEIATSVLHNVGNVLNSVNISALLMQDKIQQLTSNDLTPLATLLKEHYDELGIFFSENPQGKQIIPYLTLLAEEGKKEQALLLKEIQTLNENIQRIRSVVSAQQTISKAYGVVELTSLQELLEDALTLHKSLLTNHHINIEHHYDASPQVYIDKYKTEQILINLVRNAIDSLISSEKDNKQLTLGIQTEKDKTISIQITDNGQGILTENLSRIFNFGFTTKKEGHGFGLHTSALAAQEMGGSLVVNSEGPQQGASFTLKLPFQNSAKDENDKSALH